MKLRLWQQECFNAAIKEFSSRYKHFLCVACPGAGKTTLASVVAAHLVRQRLIDLVVCFSPSCTVAKGFKSELEKQTGGVFADTLGALGVSYTYQRMSALPESFWQLFEQKRVFVIFDEIHHCAGMDEINSNSWGRCIIQKIKNKAHYTLALSGTPWRTDNLPVSLSEYCEKGTLQHGYVYGLERAIQEGVCRIPNIIAVDNEEIVVKKGKTTERFGSFSEALTTIPALYREFIRHPIVYESLIKTAVSRLDKVRAKNKYSAGLIVVGNVDSALIVKRFLKTNFLLDAVVVTHKHNDSQERIDRFRTSTDKWIISVGMISEGTDIPRLQVCCYLSLVRTELYFRQVLGRIIRRGASGDEYCYFIMLSAPELIQFAHNLHTDIPTECHVEVQHVEQPVYVDTSSHNEDIEEQQEIINEPKPVPGDSISVDFDGSGEEDLAQGTETEYVYSQYSYGKFKEQLLTLSLSC